MHAHCKDVRCLAPAAFGAKESFGTGACTVTQFSSRSTAISPLGTRTTHTLPSGRVPASGALIRFPRVGGVQARGASVPSRARPVAVGACGSRSPPATNHTQPCAVRMHQRRDTAVPTRRTGTTHGRTLAAELSWGTQCRCAVHGARATYIARRTWTRTRRRRQTRAAAEPATWAHRTQACPGLAVGPGETLCLRGAGGSQATHVPRAAVGAGHGPGCAVLTRGTGASTHAPGLCTETHPRPHMPRGTVEARDAAIDSVPTRGARHGLIPINKVPGVPWRGVNEDNVGSAVPIDLKDSQLGAKRKTDFINVVCGESKA